MFLNGVKEATKHIFRSKQRLQHSLYSTATTTRANCKYKKTWHQICAISSIKLRKFHTNNNNRNNNIIPVTSYTQSLYFSDKPTNDNFDNVIIDDTNEYSQSLPNTNNLKHPPCLEDDTPISERPDWVLIGREDAQDVFRLTHNQLSELTAIHKEDPYKSEQMDVKSDVYTWYYLRDVWQKSCDIYGAQVVNLWYKRFKKNIDSKVQYEALYGWQRDNLLPEETPLFKWLFSHKVNELFSDNHSEDIETGKSVVKRAIKANLGKLLITYGIYLYTSSYSLWAETLHSVCDVTNQGLLFLSIRLSSTDPNFNHPYGYGASRWVASFLSGTVLFGMGFNAMYGSIYGFFLNDSIHIISDVKLGILLCGVSAILELYSFSGAFKEIRKHLHKEKYTLLQYLAHGTDSTSVHVFLEDGTGLFCSVLAGCALSATHFVNYSTIIFDVIGSFVIGGCLSVIGLILMLRNAKLLSGRSVQNNILLDVIKYLHAQDCIASSHDLKSMIVGMNTCVIKVEVNFNADKIADKHIKTSEIFKEFQQKCLKNDLDSFHDLMMKSCADYQQWLVTERSLIEIGIKQIVQNYGFSRVHVDIETY